MIIEFRVKNYRSIGDDQTFSMVAGSIKDNPHNVIEPQSRMKQGLLRSAVLYGANASGKSNIILALRTMRNLVLNSTDHKPGDTIESIDPFLFDKDLRTEPTEFDLTFICDDIRYQYGFAIDRNTVHEEWLYAYPKGQPQMLFRRTVDDDSDCSIFEFGSNFKGEKVAISERTTSNTLYLSKAASDNHPLLNNLFIWFRRSLKILNMYKHPSNLMAYSAKMIGESQDHKDWIHNLIHHADFGIESVSSEERPITDTPRFKNLSEKIRKRIIADSEDVKYTKIMSSHKADPSVKLDFDEESEGTQRYFALSSPLYNVLQNGKTLVVDELDSSMHPLLIRKIVQLFHDPEINKNNAQLIFTTHDTNLLKPEIFRRDQVWFVEKDRQEQSQYYSLLEYKTKQGDKPRKDEAWERGYLAGRYGAIPFLGSFQF